MCDKMAISAYILKIVEKDPFLRLQMRAKESFSLDLIPCFWPIFVDFQNEVVSLCVNNLIRELLNIPSNVRLFSPSVLFNSYK